MIYEELRSYAIQDTVDEIIKKYLSNAEPFYQGINNIIYFDGWCDGLGASAVLAAIAEPARSKFDVVIHADCSVWKSRRDMQRRIAKDLKLDRSAMDLFDKQDEEDDFNGLDRGSRAEILKVAKLIFQILDGRRCLMILSNGSDSEVDLAASGIPVFDWRCKVLWTFQGRFRLDPKIRDKVKSAHVFLSVRVLRSLLPLVHQEAAQINHDANSTVIADCWFYMSLLQYKYDNSIDYYQDTHASNYWVCDGIVSGDNAWEIGGQLQEAMRLNYIQNEYLEFIRRTINRQQKKSRWVSITSKNAKVQNIQCVPKETTSYFLALEKSDHPAILPKHLFGQSSKLRVLSISWCTFNFASPPFICCNNLRFVYIDSCKDEDLEIIGEGHDTEWTFLKSLWVLDIRHTRWDWILSPTKMVLMIELRELNLTNTGAIRSGWCMDKLDMTWLCDLRRLRVINSSTFLTTLVEESFMGMHKLELLDLSGNSAMQVLPNLSAAIGLKVLILDGCDGLQHVKPDVMSTSLESFSFDGYGKASRWKNSMQIPEKEVRPSSRYNQELPKVSKISLEGCARLKNVFLRGLPNLVELNLSETAIETLDLKNLKVENLVCLFLIGCENLRRVCWLDAEDPPLRSLCVDTRGKPTRSKLDGDCQRSHSYFEEDYTDVSFYTDYVFYSDYTHVVATDIRFFRGFHVFGSNFRLYISSTLSIRQLLEIEETENDGSDNELYLIPVVGSSSFPYSDVFEEVSEEGNSEDISKQISNQLLPSKRHIEFSKGGCNWELKNGLEIIISLMNSAQSLHVHDSCSITAANLELQQAKQFKHLRWCHIERCPKIHTAFVAETYHMSPSFFKSLEILWVSHLLAARSIWSRSLSIREKPVVPFSQSKNKIDRYKNAFSKLQHIHLHACPRLTFVLPWSFPTLDSLETMHITYCGELRQIFPNGDERYWQQLATNIEFPNLRTIHLQELPMLQHICEINMTAPMLETIKLRGCWSLRRLPAIHAGRPQYKPMAVVDCEKDWWDMLHWDGLEASRRLFSPLHSRYYKKTIPRGSLLR